MDHANFLLAANALVWLGLAGYLAFLCVGQKRLNERLKRLETLRDDQD